MLNLYQHSPHINGAPMKGTLGYLLKGLDYTFDSIGAVEYATPKEIDSALSERMHLLAHSLTLLNRKVLWHRTELIQIVIYWAKGSNLVLWTSPARQIYPQPILFSSFAEFVQWLHWRLEARMNLRPDDIARLRLEIESLKAKITSPPRMRTALQPQALAMTSDLELI